MRLLAGAVGAVVVAAATAGTPSYGAGERACAEGVLVVVGPPAAPERAACVAQPGDRTAAQLFEAAGHRLTRVQRFPGAVCRVDGEPADRACAAMPPADAYWGFFHAEEGDWVYASIGVDSLAPAAGEAVALSWQETAAPAPPRHSPGSAGSPTPEPATTAPQTAENPDGLPTGVPLLLLAGLAAVVAAAAWRRRR